MGDEYVTLDQHWTDMRQMATDLKAELMDRPVEVTLEIGPDLAWVCGLFGIVIAVYLVIRVFVEVGR